MKLLYFTRDYSPHDHRFLSALAGTAHQVYALRLERRGVQLEDRPLPPEITQVPWAGGRQPAEPRDYPHLLAELRRVIREIQPDLIHAGPVQSAAYLAARSGFQPLVTMTWGSDLLKEADQSPWMQRATRYTLDRTAVLVGDCRAEQEKAAEFGFPSERVVLFPWGVDLQRFKPGKNQTLRERLGWEDAFVVLSLRSWEPIYGVDVLVRGFVRAAQQVPQLRLALLGAGSQTAELRSILLQAGVMEQVYFGGRVTQTELPDWYRVADLYASASHSDGTSVSLLESLASGLPVLVTDIPGNREWVTPEQGWMFPDGDDQAVTEGILRAYEQRNQLAGLGSQSRRLAEQRADWNKNFQELLRAYQLARQGRPE